MSSHPLDPLSPVRNRARCRHRAPSGTPERCRLVRDDRPSGTGPQCSRNARPMRLCLLLRPGERRDRDGVADLDSGELLSWQHVKGAQARIVADEFAMGGEVAGADPRFHEACARRGITDMSEVLVEPWAAGHFGIAEEEGEASPMAIAGCATWPATIPMPGRSPTSIRWSTWRRRRLLRIDDFGAIPLPPESTAILHPAAPGSEAPGDHAARGRKLPSSRAIWSAGRNGSFASGSMSARVSPSTPSALRMADGCGRSCTALRSPEMVVPYGDPTGRNFIGAMPSTPAEYGIGQFLDPLTAWLRLPRPYSLCRRLEP